MSDIDQVPVCGSCGSDEITIASHCEWDLKEQEWVANDPDYNGAYCSNCSAEGTIKFISRPELLAINSRKETLLHHQVNELLKSMQIVIPLSRGEVLLLPADADDLHGYASNIYLDAAQEEFLDRSPLNDRYDREIVITDVERIRDYTGWEMIHLPPSWECLRLTVECTLTDTGGDE